MTAARRSAEPERSCPASHSRFTLRQRVAMAVVVGILAALAASEVGVYFATKSLDESNSSSALPCSPTRTASSNGAESRSTIPSSAFAERSGPIVLSPPSSTE